MCTELKAGALCSCACILLGSWGWRKKDVPVGDRRRSAPRSTGNTSTGRLGDRTLGWDPRVSHVLGSQLLAAKGWGLEPASFPVSSYGSESSQGGLGYSNSAWNCGPSLLNGYQSHLRALRASLPSALTVIVTVAWTVSLLMLVSITYLPCTSPRLYISSIGKKKSRDQERTAELRFEAMPEPGLAHCQDSS